MKRKTLLLYGFSGFMAVQMIAWIVREEKPEEKPRALQPDLKLQVKVAYPRDHNSDRLMRINAVCQALGTEARPLTSNELFYLYVSVKHRLVACLPPKAGCTTWKTILANNSRPWPIDPHYFNSDRIHNTIRKYGLKRLSNYSHTMQQYVLEQYYKFMVVRHPLPRLVSAYRDKLVETTPDSSAWKKHLGSKILQYAHPELPTSAIEDGKNVTFDEFVRFVGDRYQLAMPNLINGHWAPMNKLCHPCSIKYDRIVKLETQDVDAKEIIMNHLRPYSRGLDTHMNPSREISHRASKFLTSYNEISYSSFKGLLKYGYDLDMKLFGYSYLRFTNGTVFADTV